VDLEVKRQSGGFVVRYRDLYTEIMFYGHFDAMPVIHWNEWQETKERWIREGMPQGADEHVFLGASPMWETLISSDSWLGVAHPGDAINIGLFPSFAEEVLEEDGDSRVLKNGDGTISRELKNRTSMPQFLGYSFKNASNWDEYKRRLLPDPARLAPDADIMIRRLSESDSPACFPIGSLMGWLRNWMGLENMSYLIHDARDVFCDVIMTIANLTCWTIDQILPRLKVDLAHGWEDMCGVNGPLISPEVFTECVAPGYRKIRNKLDEYKVRLLEIDTDGDVLQFSRNLLDSGVNVLFPVEVGTFKGDAIALRKKYGTDLRMMGNFDKLSLEKGRHAVSSEIERLLPLMRQGGYIIMPDHMITPGVSLEMYRWYLDELRALSF
jgi:uroporphyrinogen decarboxylase